MWTWITCSRQCPLSASGITGYLVGTMDQWNDAKKAEERDRVKHSLRTEL